MDDDRGRATGQLGAAHLAGLALGERPQVRDRRRDRQAHFDVGPLRAELVVARVRWAGGRATEIGDAVGDVRQVDVEERTDVELAHRLRNAGGHGRLRCELDDAGIVGAGRIGHRSVLVRSVDGSRRTTLHPPPRTRAPD